MTKIFVLLDNLVIDDHSWETHVSSLLQGYVDSTGKESEYDIIEINDLSIIKMYFENDKINDTDVFIFPNAWSYMPQYIKHWSEVYQKKIRTIGYWSNSCSVNEDPIYRPLMDRNWRKVFERSSFRCLDKSFFISENFKENFRIYVSKNVFPQRLNVSRFPLDYLEIEMGLYREMNPYKLDQMIFPWSKYLEIHYQIMYDFKRSFRDTRVLFPQEKQKVGHEEILNLTAKSKVAFLPYQSTDIGKEIYECLLLGTIPVVPNIPEMNEYLPEEFLIPVEWINNIFNYCEHGPKVVKHIRNMIDYHTSYETILTEQQKILHDKYYDSEDFIKEIFGN